MELSNGAFLSGPQRKIVGNVTFKWLGGGAALVMLQRREESRQPGAWWVFGRDDTTGEYKVLYSDDRGISRIYEMSFHNNIWKMWRDTSNFSQRFEGKVSKDMKAIDARWEKSTDNRKTWEHDFNVKYERS